VSTTGVQCADLPAATTSGVALGGLVSRADLILFPVDCVSHEAMWSARRLAGQQGKPYLPMRTASLAAFTHALRQIAERAAAGAR
jgi:hypothetical protein